MVTNSSIFPFSSTLGTYKFFNTAGLIVTYINLVFRSLYTKPCLLAKLTQIFMRLCKALGEGASAPG